MAPTRPDTTSIWRQTSSPPTFTPLPGEVHTDVVVVGAGITGLTTALLLARDGAEVLVIEAGGVGAGTTGDTTGKVSSQHGVIYRDLVTRHGEAMARIYARANEQAIGQVATLCDELGIDAGFERRSSYLYAPGDDEVGELREEFEVATRLGLPATWVDDTELPFEVAGALRFDQQAQLHPMRYLAGLANALDAMPDVTLHTSTRALSVKEADDRVVIATDRGNVTAGHAVLATLTPVTDRGMEFARLSPVRAYGLAASVRGEPPLEGMYLSAGEPSWSLRRFRDGQHDYVIVVGGSHPVGQAPDPNDSYEVLERFVRRHFDVATVAARWSAQDHSPTDRLPFIGRTAFSDHIHVATGFQKWGLSAGTFAAGLLTDLVRGHDNADVDIFAPTRFDLAAEAMPLAEHNLRTARMFVEDRLRPEADAIEQIPPGQGATVRVGGELLAVSKDEDGAVTRRSATCTHLGCVVRWNTAERSWDCGCHGSRFASDGEVLNGPATRPLSER